MKYISKQKGDTTYLIPTGDPPPGKIVKSDLPRYRKLKESLMKTTKWPQEKDKENFSIV